MKRQSPFTKRFFSGFSLLSLVVLIGTGCASDNSQPAESSIGSLQNVVLRVGSTTENAMVTMRKSTKAFEGTPYTIEWVEFDSSSAVLEAVSAGAVDFAGVLQSPAALVAQGNAKETWTQTEKPFSVVAAWTSEQDPGFSLIVADKEMTSLADLSGQKIAVGRGSLGHFFLSSILEREGLDDVEVVFMPGPEARAAFQSGAVSGLVTNYKAAYAIQKAGKGKILESSNRIVPTNYVSIVSSSALGSGGKVSAIGDFLKRMEQASKDIADNPQSAVDFLSTAFKLDVEDAVVFAPFEAVIRSPLDDRTLEILQTIADTFLAVGSIDNEIDVSVLFDARLDEGVVRQQ